MQIKLYLLIKNRLTLILLSLPLFSVFLFFKHLVWIILFRIFENSWHIILSLSDTYLSRFQTLFDSFLSAIWIANATTSWCTLYGILNQPYPPWPFNASTQPPSLPNAPTPKWSSAQFNYPTISELQSFAKRKRQHTIFVALHLGLKVFLVPFQRMPYPASFLFFH